MGALNKFFFGGPGTATSVGDIGLLIARLGFGAYITMHGYVKFIHDDGIYLSDQFLGGIKAMSLPAPLVFAWLSTGTEFIGGILIAIGLLTRPAALALLINMSVAAFIAMQKMPFFDPKSPLSKEFPLLFWMFFLLVLLIGGGRFAIDSFLRRPDRVALIKRTDQ
jgi:putative oxidoreductase